MVTALALLGVVLLAWGPLGCGGGTQAVEDHGALEVVATTSLLADIAQHVSGGRVRVQSLIPPGTDPHAFRPKPGDLRRVVAADLVIVNGTGLEGSLERYLSDVDPNRIVVASQGLAPRTPPPGEPGGGAGEGDDGEAAADPDPHFWLDPILVQKYVATITAAFQDADPDNAGAYAASAAAYERELAELDEWIETQVSAVPAERRKLVMDHASHGYWADRYGFEVVGAVIPAVSTGSAPTARDVAGLLETIERQGVPAIFVQVGENSGLAARIAADAGIVVVDDLYGASLSGPDGPAASYVEMMKHDTMRIVEALKP